MAERASQPGVATGLAWTSAGGEILFVEATAVRGRKGLILTGSLGEVMKESAQIALSLARGRARHLDLPENFFEKSDVHIHVPAGAIPKDGPSAGLAMAIALISLLSGEAVRPRLAMTGEITLTGRVLPVGGIKEKLLAARRAGITQVILPRRNETDLVGVPAGACKTVTFHLVSTVDEAAACAFGRCRCRRPRAARPGRAKRSAAGSAAAR